ncbi:MAG: NnrU family protein [Pseudomonadota bacterium]
MVMWAEFAAAFGFFFLSHAVPVRPRVKASLVARIGSHGFGVAYGLLSVSALAWVISAAGRAPYVELWPTYSWQRYAVWGAMLVACQLIAFTLARPNPFSFGGYRNAAFDPARAGLIRAHRHPLLLALALWAGAHLLANGDLVHAIVFGSFAAFALLGGRMIDRRKQREMGEAWQRLWEQTRTTQQIRLPFSAIALRAGGGVALFALLLSLHQTVIGVSPLP